MSRATRNTNILKFARNSRGKRIFFKKGAFGECWDLAEEAMLFAKAKTSNDLTKPGAFKEGNYIWGRRVGLNNVAPGDVVQFDKFAFRVDKTISSSDGASSTSGTKTLLGAPNHTAMVDRVLRGGVMYVIHQNAINGKGNLVKTVFRSKVRFKSAKYKYSNKGKSIEKVVKVTGTATFYRAVGRSSR